MTVRYATEDDIDILTQHDRHISREELKISISLGRVLIAYTDQGFAGWLRYNLFWDSIPFMNMLYLLEESRGKGYGRCMVESWEADMKERGYKKVMTSTVAEEDAQHFYNRLGYRAIGGFLLGDDPYELILAKEL